MGRADTCCACHWNHRILGPWTPSSVPCTIGQHIHHSLVNPADGPVPFPIHSCSCLSSEVAPIVPSPLIAYPPHPQYSWCTWPWPHQCRRYRLKCLDSSRSLWQPGAPLRLLLSLMATPQHPPLWNQRLSPQQLLPWPFPLKSQSPLTVNLCMWSRLSSNFHIY